VGVILNALEYALTISQQILELAEAVIDERTVVRSLRTDAGLIGLDTFAPWLKRG
jgi:hypothetical protein